MKDTGYAVGEFVSDSARSVGGGIANVGRKIGMKRGAVALGILVGGIGTFMLVRYLRTRTDEVDETLESSNGVRTKKQRREAKHAHAH